MGMGLGWGIWEGFRFTVFTLLLGVVGAHAGAVALAVGGLDAPVERVVLHQLEVHAALAPLHSLGWSGGHTWGSSCLILSVFLFVPSGYRVTIHLES